MTISAYDHYKEKITQVEIPSFFKKTRKLYDEFVITRLSASNASHFSLRVAAFQFAYAFMSFTKIITKEMYLLSDNEIEKILDEEQFPKRHKQIFVLFLIYCSGQTHCEFKETYSVTRGYSKEKEIYSPEIFLNYYNYVKNIELHLDKAIKSKPYASTWLFVMMHMIDAWRKSDIVFGLPRRINTEVAGISTIEWFKENRFTFKQAQEIINQVATAVEKMQIQKTGALGHFLVNHDMMIACATALTITEFHRRKKDDLYLLQSLVTPNKNVVLSKTDHLTPFFKQKPELLGFQSRKANRTLLTYFFYNIAESNKNADMAYELARRMRGHTNEDSTAVYIQATNKDGSLDKVSLNLFNRGHFGWLYNFIVKLSFEDHHTHSTEKRTALIQAYRNEFKPIDLENLASFLQKQQNEKQSIAHRVALMPREELQKTLIKIFKGEMPARMSHAQCLLYPKCIAPSATSCSQCHYLVPKSYLLNSIGQEVKKLIHSIKTTKYDAVCRRDSVLLFKILDVLNQAVVEFGKEYVEVFIDTKILKRSLMDIQNRILLPRGE